jgi:hypothetical protein
MDLKIDKAAKVDVNGKLQPPDPGHLEKYSDDQWLFSGDGNHTPMDVTQVILKREAEITRNPVLLALEGNGDAARFLAFKALDKNSALPRDADAAITKGQLFAVDGGPSLQKLLAPFANNLPALRAALQNAENAASMSSPHKKTIGAVFSHGIAIPWEEPKA